MVFGSLLGLGVFPDLPETFQRCGNLVGCPATPWERIAK